MKTLMLFIALTASVWSSFSYANTSCCYRSQWDSSYIYTIPNSSCQSYDAIGRALHQLAQLPEQYLSASPSGNGVSVFTTSPYAYSFLNATCPETPQTCDDFEGDFIDGYHNSENDFCAIVGNTGGPTPQPLMCTATMIAEIPAFSGNFQHIVTANACSAPTGPNAPDDGTDPGEPCTENCEPTDPETPPGGGDGSDIPGTGDGPTGGNTTVGGTVTDSQGNVTNINLTMDQDFSPITNRLNEVNERLKVENKNSDAMNEWLKLINQNTVDGNLETKKVNTSIQDGFDGIGDKLDGIKEGIDSIKDGMGTEDEGRHAGEIADLPDVEHAINAGYDAIMDAMHTQANNELTNGLETIGERFTAFESIPQIFAMSADSCSPFSFGDINLNLCPYAPTTSNVLSWVLTILTMIFIITGVVADIKRVRMT